MAASRQKLSSRSLFSYPSWKFTWKTAPSALVRKSERAEIVFLWLSVLMKLLCSRTGQSVATFCIQRLCFLPHAANAKEKKPRAGHTALRIALMDFKQPAEIICCARSATLLPEEMLQEGRARAGSNAQVRDHVLLLLQTIFLHVRTSSPLQTPSGQC